MLSANPRGFYLMHRGWLDHPLFIGREYDKRSAWAHLIEMASHKNQGGLMVGQLYVTYRRLATTWNWSLSRVQRFMDALQKENMIVVETRDRKPSLVTVCNYEFYQKPERSKPVDDEIHIKTLVEHQRNVTETPSNELNQNTELNIDLGSGRQHLEELATILYGFLAPHDVYPNLLDWSHLQRWATLYSWQDLIVPTFVAWAKRNRKRANPTIIRSWAYFDRMLEKAFEDQRRNS